jgi:hypothetical protein
MIINLKIRSIKTLGLLKKAFLTTKDTKKAQRTQSYNFVLQSFVNFV